MPQKGAVLWAAHVQTALSAQPQVDVHVVLAKKNRHQGCACTRVLPRIIIHSVKNSLLAVSDTLVFFFVLRWLAKHFASTRNMYFGYSVTSFLTIYASA